MQKFAVAGQTSVSLVAPGITVRGHENKNVILGSHKNENIT